MTLNGVINLLRLVERNLKSLLKDERYVSSNRERQSLLKDIRFVRIKRKELGNIEIKRE
jgi:hypothetical protein